MKIAAAEGKRWIDELPKFLLAYGSTPQVSTGATPASLMFGKEIRTKLPELRPEKSLRDESTRDKDWEQKLKQKAYADGNRGAVPSPIVPGVQVLLKNTRETGSGAFFYIAPLSLTSQRRFTIINLPPADWKHIQAQIAAASKQSMHAGTHFTDLGRMES